MNQPPHTLQNIGTCRDSTPVLLIIRQGNHILLLEPIGLCNERLDILDIVDTSSELGILSEIVDADKKRALAALAVGELEICGRGTDGGLADCPALWWRGYF
jgi:hypothetical protein